MGGFIDKYGDKHVGILKGFAESIADHLVAGPVLVGERHSWPAARAVVSDLIIDGNVKKLFVELSSFAQTVHHVGEIGLTQGIAYADLLHRNPITLTKLIKLAHLKRIKVVGYDNPVRKRNAVGPPNPTGEAGMKARNKAMGRALSAAGPGAIALVGSAHLDGSHSRGVTVAGAANNPHLRTVDLSTLPYSLWQMFTPDSGSGTDSDYSDDSGSESD